MSQTHPQYQKDRQALNQVTQEGQNDYNLAELARLLIRYEGFPGAEDLKRDIQALLQSWQLTKESLFERTRQIHTARPVYRNSDASAEDWS